MPHSAIMQETDLALEEHLDYLKEEESISASIDGEKYMISYYPFFQKYQLMNFMEYMEIIYMGVIVTTRS